MSESCQVDGFVETRKYLPENKVLEFLKLLKSARRANKSRPSMLLPNLLNPARVDIKRRKPEKNVLNNIETGVKTSLPNKRAKTNIKSRLLIQLTNMGPFTSGRWHNDCLKQSLDLFERAILRV